MRRSARVHERRISIARRCAAVSGVVRKSSLVITLVGLLCTLLYGSAFAAAAHRLHGVVLAVNPARGEIVVRHDPFDSMPGMMMPFRVADRAVLARLQKGDEITATVNEKTEPWTLSHLTIGEQKNLLAGGVLRNVPLVRVGERVPDTSFIDQSGRPFTFARFTGERVVLAFIYTRCRDARMCPLISAKFHALQEILGSRKVHLVEITLDPSYDRPAVLRRYAKTFDANLARWTFGTGDPNTVLDFAARFGISTFEDSRFGIIHSERTVMIDPGGTIDAMIDTTAWEPNEILAQLDSYNGRASNPLARLNLWLSAEATAICGNAVGSFSGIRDLLIVLAVLGGFGYVLYFIARKIFVENA